MDCIDVHDDIDLCALGTLPEAEMARVRTHAAGCERCRADLLAAEAAASRLALAAPRVRAPAELHDRIFAAIRDDVPKVVPLPPAAPSRRPRRARLSRRLAPIAAAVVLLPLAGLLLWALALQHQVNGLRAENGWLARRNDALLVMSLPSSLTSAFQPVGNPGSAVGLATWNPGTGACYVVLDQLPPPEAGAAYRLWYTVDGRPPVDAGAVTADADGRAAVSVDTSRWRGTDYDMMIKVEQQRSDFNAPTLLVAHLHRP